MCSELYIDLEILVWLIPREVLGDTPPPVQFGVVSDVRLDMGVLDFGGDRRTGRGSLGEYNAEMAY